MRIQAALPILFASVVALLGGPGNALAQGRPQPPLHRPKRLSPRVPPARPATPPGIPPGIRPAQRPTTPPTPPSPQGAPSQGPAAAAAQQQKQLRNQKPGQAGGGNLPDQFQTGIKYKPMSPRAMVTFNLEDADLPDLVRLISNITGKRFIMPGKLRSIKATVYAPTKVPVAAAYEAFLSILEVNGLTVVPAGRYLKIVETQGAETQSLPTGEGAVPSDDRYITHIEQLDNVGADDVATLLGRFKSQTGSITAYAPTNMLIITDTGNNIRRMMRIVHAIDVPRTGEQIWIEPIHYANADDLAEKLQEIFPTDQPSGTPGNANAAAQAQARARAAAARRAMAHRGGQQGGSEAVTVGEGAGPARVTKIIPEERSNSLIIMATERAYLRILELIKQLDVPLEGQGRIHVYYLQHSDAEEVAKTLQNLVQGSGAPKARTPHAGAAQGGPQVASLFEGEVKITAHKPSNALVITSSLHDYAELRSVIEQLDAPRRQVFIEAVIMELTVHRSHDIGLSFHGGLADTPTNGSLSVLGFNAATSTFSSPQDLLTGLAVGVRGPTIQGSQQLVGIDVPAFGVVLNAIAQSGDSNVLSTPHIIAMDNTEAEISVGENVPLQTSGIPAGVLGGLTGLGGLGALAGQQGNASSLAGLAGLSGGIAGGIQRQDVGTTIKITPHINDNNEVRLEIQEEISQAGAPEGDLGVVPIQKRTAKTETMVRDAQTVVIGGLMRDDITSSQTKVPILGDIPVLGALFRHTTKEKRKTNLLLFLTPYIIRDPADLRAIFERKMRERQEFLDRYFVFGDHEYSPPVDYSRTRGLVEEILNELHDIKVEHDLAEQAKLKPPPEHKPRAPVGSAADLGADQSSSAHGDDGSNGDNIDSGDVIVEPDNGQAPDQGPIQGPQQAPSPDEEHAPPVSPQE